MRRNQPHEAVGEKLFREQHLQVKILSQEQAWQRSKTDHLVGGKWTGGDERR